MKVKNLLWASYLLMTVFSCGGSIPEEIQDIYESLPEEVGYNEHVQPILSDRCFTCHGPDANTRKSGLRLDNYEDATSHLPSKNGSAIVPGKPGKSLAIMRLFSEDPDMIMPPPENNLTLNSREKALIYKWIDQGAEYEGHWAFQNVTNPSIPESTDDFSAYNSIDSFIMVKLNQEEMKQSSEASKEQLLRRVTMDLTGLPPTLEEIENYLTDDSEDAYEKVVDRLLSSKGYAERMAMEWMDVSRYADSHGLHADGARFMWPWRDWVIDAFIKNMPYDEFVTWQLAGDLIPEATFDQKLATAFNRNHSMTAEGGAIDEEFRLNYVYDRTETFATAFLGLTVGCARCHDHKFDPISQKEFYQMAAFFNNVKELGMTGDDGNYGPMLPIISEEAQIHASSLYAIIDDYDSEINSQEKLEEVKSSISQLPPPVSIDKRIAYTGLDRIKDYVVDGYPSVKGASNDNEVVEGKNNTALIFTGEYDEVYFHKVKCLETHEPFSGAMWINTTKRDSSKTQTLMGTSGEKNNFWRGWDFYLDEENRVNLRLIHSLPHNYIHARTEDSIHIDEWAHVAFSYDGSSKARGIQLYINGKKKEKLIEFDQLYRSIHPVTVATHLIEKEKPIRIAKSYRNYTGEGGVFRGAIDEIVLYKKELSSYDMCLLSGSNNCNQVTKIIDDHYLKSSQYYKTHMESVREAVKERESIFHNAQEIMVMEEMPEPRKAYLYNRGEYTEPAEEVVPETPAILPPLSSDEKPNRLGLARWVFSKDHPLTSRVTVNRYWQMLFGTGLVKSSNDFGLQGSKPSHPALLDHLAYEFIEKQWDVKWLIKKMVMSYTYRQSSDVTEDHLEKDPENILLARSPSYRLQAEMIRDNALAASGLLVNEVGGESVKPYQPDGLWIEKSSFSHQLLHYKEDQGDSLYRRSLYTFLRRTSPPPSMTIFDAPNREICTIKRENTNTPLQALVLLNDPQFVEAARILAERVQAESGPELEEQIGRAFTLCTGRKIKNTEMDLLVELFQSQKASYEADSKLPEALLKVGDSESNPDLNPVYTAALTVVTSTILNHNETYMKR